jgi:hypothetical protein
MADFDEILVKIATGIDTATSGENNLGKLGLGQLEKQLSGSVTNSLDIRKVANIQNVIRNATGANLNLGGIANIADCVKNLDDLLIERVKQEVMDKILETETAQEIVEKLGEISAIAKEAGNLLRLVNELKEKSLAELLVNAKNAGLLDKVKIIKEINDKFGDVVDNLNDIIANLNSFNICSMVNYKTGVALPPASKVSTKTPIPFKPFKSLLRFNKQEREINAEYNIHTHNAGKIISEKANLDPTPENQAMLTSLQGFYYRMKNVIVGLSGGSSASASNEIERIISTKRDEWPGQTLDEFRRRASLVTNQITRDAGVLRAHRNINDPSPQQREPATGINIYGTPDWDFNTFLSIIPEERPKDLTDYWTERGFEIEKGEQQLKKAGRKPGILKADSIGVGTYGNKLVSGFTAASTKYRGGAILELQNSDGSLFDPAGINPNATVVVADTGDPNFTFDKPAIFVDKESHQAYKNSNLAGVRVVVLQKGYVENSEYLAAQNQRN